jgi:hypothetical protein
MHWIKSLFCLLPFLTFGQANDTVLPQIEFEDYPVDFENKTVKFNLEWADTIIKKTHQIYMVQLRPLCDDGKKRKTIPPHSNSGKEGCYTETVIRTARSNYWYDTVIGFDRSRMYKWKALDSADCFSAINAALGKRESDVVNACYDPRHALVFMDSMDQIIGINEICFSCGKSRIAFRNVEYVNIYVDDFRFLKKLFMNYGYEDLTNKITRKTRRIRAKHFA